MGQATISLDPSEDGFILRKTETDGTKSIMSLTGKDILTLAQSAIHLQQVVLSQHDPKGGDFAATAATEVAQIALNQEALGESILLTLIAPGGSRATFAIPRHIAKHLSDRLPVHLAQMDAAKPSRQ
jgi:hypothetical protein